MKREYPIKPPTIVINKFKRKDSTFVEFQQGYMRFTIKYDKELWPSVTKMINEIKKKGQEL